MIWRTEPPRSRGNPARLFLFAQATERSCFEVRFLVVLHMIASRDDHSSLFVFCSPSVCCTAAYMGGVSHVYLYVRTWDISYWVVVLGKRSGRIRHLSRWHSTTTRRPQQNGFQRSRQWSQAILVGRVNGRAPSARYSHRCFEERLR